MFKFQFEHSECSSTPRLKLLRRRLFRRRSLSQLRVAECIPHPRGNSTENGMIRAQGIEPLSEVHEDHVLLLGFFNRFISLMFTGLLTIFDTNLLVGIIVLRSFRQFPTKSTLRGLTCLIREISRRKGSSLDFLTIEIAATKNNFMQ